MDVLIYGAGALGRQVHYLADTYFKDRLNILGFIDDFKEKDSIVVDGLRVLGPLSHVSTVLPPEKTRLILAIGYNKMADRRNAFTMAKELGYRFESLIHPKAMVEENAELGEGVVILAVAIVDQYVKIKEINFMDIGTRIGENTVVGANNYFSAGTTLAGSVTVGENNFFGLNSTVVDGMRIGNNNFINACALVYKYLGDNRKVVEFYEQRIIGNK